MLRFLRGAICETKGGTLVESVIAYGLAFFMLMFMGEFCFTLYCGTTLKQAAMTGAEYASTHGSIANKMSGGGSGPELKDSDGSNIAKVVAASMAQFALKRSIHGFAVCPAWWVMGTEQGGFAPSQCISNGTSHLGIASYYGTGNANPGNVVTVQATWKYIPYIPVPWTTMLTYTATDVVTY